MTRHLLTAACFLALLASAPFAHAGDETVPGPRNLPVEETPVAPAPMTPEDIPLLRPADLKLLPIDQVERMKLYREHKELMQQINRSTSTVERLEKQLAARKNPNDKKALQLRTQLGKARVAYRATMAKALPILEPYGVDGFVLERVAQAPQGIGREARYAHSLVLALADLDARERAFFERVVHEVNASWFTLTAQKRRLELVAKQAELDRDRRRQLVGVVDQQLRLIDQRFWQLVDFVLDEDQRYTLMQMLPQSYTRIQNAVEHLYQIPGLQPDQAARIKSLLTEIEAELSPDQALVRRLQQEARDKSKSKEEKAAIQRELTEATTRIQDLTLWSAEQGKEILTEEQYRYYRAIPPRLSHNDRRQAFKQVFERVNWSAEQKAMLSGLERSTREAKRAAQKKIADLRSKTADYGPDSPQMGMMQMEMAGVAAEGAVIQRKLIGRVFRDVLTQDQVSAWVLGLTGRSR
jgi:hypothetical protein